MGLTSGTKLGPYEIQSPLGAGGMGEVYRAKDTRLDRIVAIKVLPAHLSSDPDLKQRLEREAKAISALQHANICTLYDIGTQGGTEFLVMEYLEGQTLADRLQKGSLPVEQVLKIATEVARALEKAHQQGIIHRDLKPANIMLTKAGAKLMDFGLAKPTLPMASQVAGPFTPSTPTMNLASLTSAASPLAAFAPHAGSLDTSMPGKGSGRPYSDRARCCDESGLGGRCSTWRYCKILPTIQQSLGGWFDCSCPRIDRTLRLCGLSLGNTFQRAAFAPF